MDQALWISFATVCAFATVNAMLAFFLDFCFNEGNIFAFYYRWLLDRFDQHWLGKPLGLCVYCMNVWLAIASYAVLAVLLDLMWFWMLPYILVSHTALRLFNRWL